MKELKINSLNDFATLNDDELLKLRGGESGLFCSSGGNCNCSTDSAKKNVRKSWRKFNKKCGTTGSQT